MTDQVSLAQNHNLVGLLVKPPPKYCVFQSMVRVLNSCKITKALRENPVLYRDMIVEFWTNAQLNTSEADGIETIVSNVKGTVVVISEDVIRRALGFDDQPGFTTVFDNEKIQEALNMMNYEGTFPPIWKKLLPPFWRFLAHTFIMCISGRSTGSDEISKKTATAIVALAMEWDYNFSRFVLEEMQSNLGKKRKKSLVLYPRFLQMIFNEVYPDIPRSDDTIDLKSFNPGTFRLMFQNKSNKSLEFKGELPLVKFGRFANIEGEHDDEEADRAPVAAPRVVIQDEVVENASDQADVIAPAQTEVFSEPQPDIVSQPPTVLSTFATSRHFALEIGHDAEYADPSKTRLTEEEIDDMLVSEDYCLSFAELQAEIAKQATLPPLVHEFAGTDEVQETFNLNEPTHSIEESTDSEAEYDSSSLASRKRKRVDLGKEEEANVELTTVNVPGETEKEAETTEREIRNLDEMVIDDVATQERTVELEENVEKEAEDEQVEDETMAEKVSGADDSFSQEKRAGKAAMVDESVTGNIPVITMDQLFKRAKAFPVDETVGGSRAGGSGSGEALPLPPSPPHTGFGDGADDDSDFDDDNDNSQLQRIFKLEQEIVAKDLLIGRLDVRVSELENANSAKDTKIANLEENLSSLSASVLALKDLLGEKLGRDFHDAIEQIFAVPNAPNPPTTISPLPITSTTS